MNWTPEKPDFKQECLLITANNFSGLWAYKLWTIEKVEMDGHWYLGLLCEDGEEWGDLADLKADLYCVLPMLEATLYQKRIKSLSEDLEDDDGNWIHDIDMGAR